MDNTQPKSTKDAPLIVNEDTSALMKEIKRGEHTEQALQERLRFEQLLSDLSARFVSVPPDQVDLEIEE